MNRAEDLQVSLPKTTILLSREFGVISRRDISQITALHKSEEYMRVHASAMDTRTQILSEKASHAWREQRTVMKCRERIVYVSGCAVLAALAFTGCNTEQPRSAAPAVVPVAVTVPARAGAVAGKTENSDAFIWELFTQFAAPASQKSPSPTVFETWASDEDTFNVKPHWPTQTEPLRFHVSVLQASKAVQPTAAITAFKIDVSCNPPTGGAVGAFPTMGPPTPCIAEQVARNHPEYDYIVNNKLNTQSGLAAAYKSNFQVDMPVEAIAIKGDWIPLQTLLQWIPQIGDVANIRKLYYTTTVGPVEYALLSMHVSSRQNPDWVWGTFEHQMNPGRCDAIGCYDSFGAQTPEVLPNKQTWNTQYGSCPKTPQLKALMTKANLSPVWDNYCLKSTQVDFTAADGTPYALGNSVIEGIVGNGTIAASSCISCHAYASFGATGSPTASAKAILPFNPTGKQIPSVLAGSHTFSFNWGLLLAPK